VGMLDREGGFEIRPYKVWMWERGKMDSRLRGDDEFSGISGKTGFRLSPE